MGRWEGEEGPETEAIWLFSCLSSSFFRWFSSCTAAICFYAINANGRDHHDEVQLLLNRVHIGCPS